MFIFEKRSFKILKYYLPHLSLVLCLTFYTSFNLKASEKNDTLSGKDTIVTPYLFLNDINNSLLNYREVDKSLNGFQIYFPPNNELYISYNDLSINQFTNNSLEYGYKGHLGNLGSATKNADFEFNLPFGSNTGFSSFDDYILNTNESKYFNLKKPYTELYYVAGSKREQIFNISHAQSINPNLNLGFDFVKNNSTGFYSHQKSDNSNFSAQLEYLSNNNRYHIIGNTVFNKISSQENGGLVLDSLFEDVINITKSAIPTFLDSAENNWKGRNYTIKQIYLLGNKEIKSINDTIDSIFFNPKSKFSHTIQYSTWKHAYNDFFPDINYYPAIYRDTLITADTLFTRSIKQSIGWSNKVHGIRKNDTINPLNFEIDLSQEYVEYHQNEVDSFVNNFWLQAKIERHNTLGLSWNLSASYIVLGDNLNDLKVGGLGSYSWGDNGNRISFFATFKNTSPVYIFQRFDSNHYKWNNKLSKTSITKTSVDYSQTKNKFSIGAQAYLIDKYIYFNEFSTPSQMGNAIAVYGAYLRKDYSAGNWAYNSRLVYQFSDASQPIRVPELTVYQSISISNWLFKKALFVKLGFDVYYNTAYYADGYSPALASFHIQNQKEIGNYPYLDFFACFRIKKARLFFLISHLNAGWFGNRYYLTPHYPAQDLSLKFGASWMFYD